MENKKNIFIVVVVVAVVLIGLVAFIGNKSESGPGKYDQFAQCLTDKGMKFYGAFWCPHCQAMKKLFGSSTKYLNYIECSNTDTSQNQTCKDAKIEGYPTFEFPSGFSFKSANTPTICPLQPGPDGQPASCSQSGVASSFYKTYIFPDAKILTEKDATEKDGTWSFVPGSRTTGEINFENLSQISNCPLPDTNTAVPSTTTTPLSSPAK